MRSDLIFDVGLHKGEDTQFYLQKGFAVVGIEANPALIQTAKIRFRDEIASGKLTLIEGAIAPPSAGDSVVFYANTDLTVWGTIDLKWASRNEMLGSPSQQTKVNRVDIVDVYRSFGIPFYLKVDVEGVDRFVIEQLKSFDGRPQYLSLELEKLDFGQLEAEMGLLKSLGYRKFKIVQQQTVPGTKITAITLTGRPFEYVFEFDASGPFGDELTGPWLTYDEAIERYRSVFRRYRHFGDYSPIKKMPERVQRLVRKLYRMGTGYEGPLPGWFDTHASL